MCAKGPSLASPTTTNPSKSSYLYRCYIVGCTYTSQPRHFALWRHLEKVHGIQEGNMDKKKTEETKERIA
jgi:hypothetical protein